VAAVVGMGLCREEGAANLSIISARERAVILETMWVSGLSGYLSGRPHRRRGEMGQVCWTLGMRKGPGTAYEAKCFLDQVL